MTVVTRAFDIGADLELAQKVQFNFLPQNIPSVQGVEVFADSQSAHAVGGDFYDLIAGPNASLLFAVGDVSYKGVSAALITAVLHKVLRTGVKVLDPLTPGAILNYINTDMYDELAVNAMFATAFIGQFLPQQQKLIFSNAGHSPVIYRKSNGNAILVEAEHPPLGIIGGETYANQTLQLAPDDLLVILTDGYPEYQNRAGHFFGYERILRTIDTAAHQCPAAIADLLYTEVDSFGSGMQRNDDQAIMIIKGKSQSLK